MKTFKFQHPTSRESPNTKRQRKATYIRSARFAPRKLKLGASLVLLLAQSANAQNYSVDWYKISGGGGTSTGGVYSVSGTIGQHDAGGPLTGGNYSLTGGFWALPSVVQMPGAPTLYISHSGNTVTVYWQAVFGWNLIQNNNLANIGNWSTNTSWTTANGTNYLNTTPPTGNLFFRLTKP